MRPILVLLILTVALGSVMLFSEESRADWTYTVHRGDTLYLIAKKTGVTVNSIKHRSGYWSNHLRIGQKLIIPTYTTKARTTTYATGNTYLLAQLIQAEAGAEPYVGKVAVGGVVLNRIQNSKFPSTIAGVVYQPHAFESVSNGIIYRPVSNDSIKAARDAISGWDPSGGALYFFNPAKTNNRWIWARQIINRIGEHVFAI